MNDNVKQPQLSSIYNHATASTYQDRLISKTKRHNHQKRTLSSHSVLISNTTIRKNDTVISSNNNKTKNSLEKQQPLCSSRLLDVTPMVVDTTPPQPQHYGFVDGDFTSGQICRLQLRDRSYCHSYNYDGTILVVGTATSIDFYDTTSTAKNNIQSNNCHQYSIIASVPHTTAGSGMISAIVWITPPTISSNESSNVYHNYYCSSNTTSNLTNHSQLLAISDLSGRIYLYSINSEILESQGPTLMYYGSNKNGTQIRCLSAGYCHCNGDEPNAVVLVLAAGDKSGGITIITFDSTLQPSDPLYIDTKQLYAAQQQYIFKEVQVDENCDSRSKNHNGNSSGGILGIAFELERGMMAVSTSSGLVQVFSLFHLLSFDDNCDDCRGSRSTYKLLWSSQNTNASAIRCIVFGPNNSNTLLYGGYDKTIVMVDTDQWTKARELNVQGTVRLR